MIKTRFAAIWPILLAVAFCCRTDAALGQVPSAEFPVNGVDYRFKRMVTRRPVNDAADSGRIKLVSYVYEPLHDNQGDVVIVLHGSTGGMASSPNEPLNVRGFPIDFLLGRGLTVVVPLRRGRAESTGTYVEECPYYPGRCSLADNRLLAESGLADAIASTDAVLDDVLVKLNPRDGKVVLWGLSRGGFLALDFAATAPTGFTASSPFRPDGFPSRTRGPPTRTPHASSFTSRSWAMPAADSPARRCGCTPPATLSIRTRSRASSSAPGSRVAAQADTFLSPTTRPRAATRRDSASGKAMR